MVHLRHSTSTISTDKCFLPAGTDPPHHPLMKVCEAAQRPKQVKSESHSVKAYADNATLLSTSKEAHQTLLLELDDKCSEIGLQIHPNKCVSFVFNGQKICRKYAENMQWHHLYVPTGFLQEHHFCSSYLARRGAHNEIHDTWRLLKPCLVKYFKWLLKVIKEQRAGKGQILFVDQSTKGTLEARSALW